MPNPTYALSIVVPVYNGAQTVGTLVHALAALEIVGGHEIVLVVDGSPDDSLAVCRRLAAETALPITVVNHSRNYGEHNAVMTGLRHARGAYIINMDDDLQNPPEEVKRLYEHTRDHDYDVVYTYYATKHHAGWRNLGSAFHNRIADFLLDKPKGLYLSSFRCVNAFLAGEITRYDGPFPYIDGLILQTTKSIGTLQVAHLPRAEGRSNYTLRRLLRLWLSMALNFSVMPLRAATLFGLVMSVLGFLGLVEVAVEALLGQTPSGWGSTLVIVLLFSGAQLLMLGIAGEYLGRLFLTVNKRPQAVVRDVTRSDAAQHDKTPDLRAVGGRE
ncbi:MAG: glycosyltransferase family 2 protein [Pseudomonadota bacterium]